MTPSVDPSVGAAATGEKSQLTQQELVFLPPTVNYVFRCFGEIMCLCDYYLYLGFQEFSVLI